ncbi:unnamed protein product, partial [Prorocentrum cordatum]
RPQPPVGPHGRGAGAAARLARDRQPEPGRAGRQRAGRAAGAAGHPQGRRPPAGVRQLDQADVPQLGPRPGGLRLVLGSGSLRRPRGARGDLRQGGQEGASAEVLDAGAAGLRPQPAPLRRQWWLRRRDRRARLRLGHQPRPGKGVGEPVQGPQREVPQERRPGERGGASALGLRGGPVARGRALRGRPGQLFPGEQGPRPRADRVGAAARERGRAPGARARGARARRRLGLGRHLVHVREWCVRFLLRGRGHRPRGHSDWPRRPEGAEVLADPELLGQRLGREGQDKAAAAGRRQRAVRHRQPAGGGHRVRGRSREGAGVRHVRGAVRLRRAALRAVSRYESGGCARRSAQR